MGCQVSKGGIQNQIDFWQKVNTPQGNNFIFQIDKVQKSILHTPPFGT